MVIPDTLRNREDILRSDIVDILAEPVSAAAVDILMEAVALP